MIKVIYQVISGDGDHAPQFDEQFRLITADEDSWAKEKAMVLARRGECSFLNTKQEQVQWKLVGVAEVCRIADIDDGMLLLSQTPDPEDPEEYISLMKSRAQRLFEGAWQNVPGYDLVH